MSVGIEDDDFNQYKWVALNLDVMKLSSFYKRRHEIVILTPDFCPEKHTHFFYRKDYMDNCYPLNLTQYSNVQYGGLAFSNNKYIPMDIAIEGTRPDTSIYERIGEQILGDASKEYQATFKNMLTSEHFRLSLDGKTIWPNFEKQFINLKKTKSIVIHDFDLGQIDKSFETVKYVFSQTRKDGCAPRLGMKFPIQVYDGQSLLNWSSFKAHSTLYSVTYNGVMDNDAFVEWVGHMRSTAVFKQIDYEVTKGDYTEEYFTKVLIRRILRQIIFARSFNIFLEIKYDENFFTDKRWVRVLKMFNFFAKSHRNEIKHFLANVSDDTIYCFAKKCGPVLGIYKDAFVRDEMRDIFKFVREKNPDLFIDFYECTARSLEGMLYGRYEI